MDNTTNFEATGVDSGETITLVTYATPGTGVVSANTRTITSAALRVTTLSSPPATTYAGGTNGVTFAQVQLDATGSSEDLKVTQMIVKHISNSTALPIDIQNIRLWVDKDGDSNNGTGTAEELSVVNAGASTTADTDEAETFNLSGVDQFTVKAGKRLVVYVKGDIAGGATQRGLQRRAFALIHGMKENFELIERIARAGALFFQALENFAAAVDGTVIYQNYFLGKRGGADSARKITALPRSSPPSRLHRPAAWTTLSRPPRARKTTGKSRSTPASTTCVAMRWHGAPAFNRPRTLFRISVLCFGHISAER